MTKSKSLSVIAIFVTMGLLLFQNCSKVGVADLSSGSLKAAGAGVAPVSEPVVSVPPSSTPVDGKKPPVVIVDTEVKNPGMSTDLACEENEKEEEELAIDQDEKDLAVACLEASKQAKTVANGSDVIRTGDQKKDKVTVLQGQSFGKIAQNRGNLVIIGMGPNAKIESVEDNRGHITICNMKVESISNLRGRLDLMDSEVKEISDVHNIHQSPNNHIAKGAPLKTMKNGELRVCKHVPSKCEKEDDDDGQRGDFQGEHADDEHCDGEHEEKHS